MSHSRQKLNRIQMVDLEQAELHCEDDPSPSPLVRLPGLPDEIFERSLRPARRKRAPKACLACRARKVRCDVSLCGEPCMNCRTNGGDCMVVGRPTKYRTSKNRQRDSRGPQIQSRKRSASPLKTTPRSDEGRIRGSRAPQIDNSLGINAETQQHKSSRSIDRSRYIYGIDGEDTGDQVANEKDLRRLEKSWGSSTNVLAQPGFNASPGMLNERLSTEKQSQVSNIQPLSVNSDKHTAGAKANPAILNGTLLSEICGIFGVEQPQNMPSVYTQHALVEPDDFSQNPSQDIEFLKAQGSFQIPVSPALDEFMRQYFSHVHPHLPLIDESAFWDAFAGKSRGHGHGLDFPISNFTFQAMLFACCSFVPLNVLRDVGFHSIRDARKTLYRRAKLLFDFNGRRSPISTAQGALLLSYSPETHNRKVNSFWLDVAIQHAKDANAHAYDSASGLTDHERIRRKRLFWCCILRDRILPLGVRRPVFITDAHFDFDSCSPLNAKDLENETNNSKVYDPETKRSLAELIGTLCELAIVLTGVIMILSPPNEIPVASASGAEFSRSWMLIQQIRSDLSRWYENANEKFPTPAGLGDTHESVILYTNLMYLYYYSAQMALCHHELFISKLGFKTPSRYPAKPYRIKADLQGAATGITDIMKELLQLRLVKFLPISVVAYIALPLVLNILDVKLSLTKSQCSVRQRRLQIFMEVMKVLQTQYDGTDRISDAIERIIRYLAVNNNVKSIDSYEYSDRHDFNLQNHTVSSTSTASESIVTEWGDVLIRLPTCYLRIVMTMDLVASKGEYPEEADFPLCLQTARLANSLPLYRMSLAQGGQSNQITTRAQNTVARWRGHNGNVRYDKSGNSNPGAAIDERSNSQIASQSGQRELFEEYSPLEPVPETSFGEEFARQVVSSDDSHMDMYGSKDLQLDTWMFDVLQDFS